MMQQLPPFASDRPGRADPEVLLAAARVLGSRMGADCDSPDAHDDIARALKEDSAYKMAESLNSACWVVDDGILEVLLDGSFHVLLTAHRDAVAVWVQERGIRPQQAIGDKVSVAYQGTLIEGSVASVNEMEATYTVNSPQLGHVHPGHSGATGIIVPFEAIHSLVQVSSEQASALPTVA